MNKTQARQFLSEGNNKLDKTIGIWNLPVTMEVCGRLCKGCYALKAQVLYPSVLPSRERKLELSKQLGWTINMIEAIKTLGLSFVRIHESGEFYSQEYVNNWTAIMKALPDVTFTFYTKRMLDFNFNDMKKLDNVIAIDSLASGRLNYGTIDKKPADMVLCPSTKANKIGCRKGCDTCYNTSNKVALGNGIFFIKH